MVVLLPIITSIITSITTSVITSLLPFITVPLLPIITVIMGSSLPIIARSIIENNRFIITYYWPGQLGDAKFTDAMTANELLVELMAARDPSNLQQPSL